MSQNNVVSYVVCIVIAAIVSTGVVLGLEAKRKQSGDAPVVSRDDVRDVVFEVIDDNPQRIVDSVDKLFKVKQQEEQARRESQVIHFKDDGKSPTVGNPNADVVVVEFFDYSCGFCKKVLSEKTKLLENDSNIKYVFKEFPILGSDSYQAARAALAVHMIAPDKYYEYHKALLKHSGSRSGDLYEKLAADLGVDTAKFKEQMDAEEITNAINANLELGRSFGIRGTPAFIINDKLVPGAISYEKMKELVEAARAKKN